MTSPSHFASPLIGILEERSVGKPPELHVVALHLRHLIDNLDVVLVGKQGLVFIILRQEESATPEGGLLPHIQGGNQKGILGVRDNIAC